MSDVVVVALIVGGFGLITGFIGPWVLSRQLSRQRQREKEDEYALRAQEKKEEYARQDQVAAQAAQAADLLLAQQTSATAAAKEVARLAAETAQSTADKLTAIGEQAKEIHTLVNSDMTSARSAELTTTRLMLVAVERVIALDEAAGRKPAAQDIEAVKTARDRIAELQLILADRLVQQKLVEAEAAESKATH